MLKIELELKGDVLHGGLGGFNDSSMAVVEFL